MRNLKISLFLLVILAASKCLTYAETADEKISLGIGINTVQLKYKLCPNMAASGYISYGEGIFATGGRLLYDRNIFNKTNFYTGVELGRISFNNDSLIGNGYLVGIPLGIERFINKKVSLEMDIGPSLIILSANNIDVSVNGIEWIINTGLNFYF